MAVDYAVLGENYGPFNAVFKFSDISRPAIGKKHSDVCEILFHFLFMLPAVFPDKMVRQ